MGKELLTKNKSRKLALTQFLEERSFFLEMEHQQISDDHLSNKKAAKVAKAANAAKAAEGGGGERWN